MLDFLLKDDPSGGSPELRAGAHHDGNTGDPASYRDAGGRDTPIVLQAELNGRLSSTEKIVVGPGRLRSGVVLTLP